MDKMLVAVFDSDTAAFDGLSALRDLHRDGDIALYGWAVTAKDETGKVSVRQAPEEGGPPLGAALGLLTGKLLEVLRGPAGLAMGASLPGLTGFMFDLDMSRLGPKFLDEVAQALTPGKAAVLAEVDESSTTRTDERLRKHGGMVLRRLPAELIEDQLVAESADFEVKLRALAQKLKQAVVEKKTAVQKDIEQVKRERKAVQDQAKAMLDQAKAEMAAKLTALQDLTKGVDERVKARIERRIADLNANFNLRSSKLSQASTLANEL